MIFKKNNLKIFQSFLIKDLVYFKKEIILDKVI
jgi:hypothetical protein